MITIKKDFIEVMLAHIKVNAPNEACGILAGSNSIIKKVYKMKNVDNSPETFIMEPKEQLQVMKEIRGLGLEMLGIYHSHLISGAYPSRHDVELAFYPEVSYVIISLKDNNNPVVCSFKIIEGKISEEQIRIE